MSTMDAIRTSDGSRRGVRSTTPGRRPAAERSYRLSGSGPDPDHEHTARPDY